MDVIIAATLRELREGRKITLKELAESLGVTVAQASYLENGKRALSLDKAAKMAEIYNTTIDNIYKLVKNQEMMEQGWKLNPSPENLLRCRHPDGSDSRGCRCGNHNFKWHNT